MKNNVRNLFIWLKEHGFVQKFNPDQPRGDDGKWSSGGPGGKDYNHEVVRRAVEAEGHAAGMRRASEIINAHHQGEGKYHPDVHTKLSNAIAVAKAPSKDMSGLPLTTDRQKGFAKGLQNAHAHLKSHERRMKGK